jgi:hypothetical protein
MMNGPEKSDSVIVARAAMPLGEWTRRLGALPVEAYDCFMVGPCMGSTEYKRGSRQSLVTNGRLPSGHRAHPPDHGSLPPCSRGSRTSLRRR